MNLKIIMGILGAGAVLAGIPDSRADEGLNVARAARLVWTEPGQSSADSVPLGNGDIALNIWQEQDGAVSFYIAKSDAWDAFCRLIKVGQVRIWTEPSSFVSGDTKFDFCPDEGCVRIQSEKENLCLSVRVDANHPIIVAESKGSHPVKLHAELVRWRPSERPLGSQELHGVYGVPGLKPTEYPDRFVPGENEVLWYQRNEGSIWKGLLKPQDLAAFGDQVPDPLLYRTFGGCLGGPGLTPDSDHSVASEVPSKEGRVMISIHSAQKAEVRVWEVETREEFQKLLAMDASGLWTAHKIWWQNFWDRSWIVLGGFPEAGKLNSAYVWQRFMLACCGRGVFPVKFNGALFTADWVVPPGANRQPEPTHADYRRWGGAYWFQNTRLLYWAMLGAGDYDEMLPLFRMYRDMLPLAEYRTKTWFGHDGAFFHETAYFFGLMRGYQRKGPTPADSGNSYDLHYWTGGLELCSLMIEYQKAVQDPAFLKETLLPIASSVLTFFRSHYTRDDGTFVIEPGQSLEQFHQVKNALPDVAGLAWTLDGLLALDGECITDQDRQDWRKMRAALPPVPLTEDEKGKRLAAAELLIEAKARNTENPELYAIFPFRLYGIGRADLEMARRSFDARAYKATGAWRQDGIQAACLGLGEQAAGVVKANFSRTFSGARFEGFRGPNFDWVPDMDHGAVGMITLQKMLCQSIGNEVYLLPAWPSQWNVHFKVPLAKGACVTGTYNGGVMREQLDAPNGLWKIHSPL
ncbi:MAG: DUF5703 domain-containing protein [Chthoniobacteraceae bacterium]